MNASALAVALRALAPRAALLLALLLPAAPALASQDTLCLPTSGVVSGLTIVTGANAALKALATSNAGDSAPANDCSGVPVEGQHWLDTSGAQPVSKLYDGSAWQVLGTVDASTGQWEPPVGGGATSIASAATTDLWSIPQSAVTVTGTTTISKLAGSGAVVGTVKFVTFSGALLLTYDATQLVLPGGRNIATGAGDTATVMALGGGNVRVLQFTPASGLAVNAVPSGHVDQFLGASCPATWIEPSGGTVGDASSGSSIRANADTFALFSASWALNATVAPIFTSGGSSSSRGATAAADFAAHKRLTVPDMRGMFLRALDDGRGVDTSRLLGSQQAMSTSASGLSASATSTFTGDSLTSSGTVSLTNSGGSGGGIARGSGSPVASAGISVSGTPTGTVSTSVTISGSAETRPTNVALLTCVKL